MFNFQCKIMANKKLVLFHFTLILLSENAKEKCCNKPLQQTQGELVNRGFYVQLHRQTDVDRHRSTNTHVYTQTHTRKQTDKRSQIDIKHIHEVTGNLSFITNVDRKVESPKKELKKRFTSKVKLPVKRRQDDTSIMKMNLT